MLKNFLAATAVATCGLALPASAATVNFVGAPNDGTTITTAEATLTAAAGTTLQVGDFVVNAVCGLGGYGCNGSFTMAFNFDVENVVFDYGYGNPGDSAVLTLLDGLGGLIANVALNLTGGTSTQSLAAYGALRTIIFDNTAATGAGYAYGNISYDRAAVVPLPAGMPLLLAAFGALGLLRRRRRA